MFIIPNIDIRVNKLDIFTNKILLNFSFTRAFFLTHTRLQPQFDILKIPIMITSLQILIKSI